MGEETAAELRQDLILGVGFLALGIATLRRLRASGGSEAVITTFYSLILFTSLTRAVWFLIPTSVLEPSYTPTAQYAFDGDWWIGTYVSEMLLFLGSLSLFSIFILIAIYWADLLKKIFKDTVRASRPMASFTTVAACLFAAEGLNSGLFLLRVYSSQGMILFDSILLTTVSLVCSVEISRFSHRFRSVLRTLGAINQVSTEAQVTRIVRITITGNIFFAVRAACEVTVGMLIYMYYKHHHSVDIEFNAQMWYWYVLIKHSSEWLILFFMLWILHSPQDASSSSSYHSEGDGLYGEDEELGGAPGAHGSGGSGGEDEYWDGAGDQTRYEDSPAGRQPLTSNGGRRGAYGAV